MREFLIALTLAIVIVTMPGCGPNALTCDHADERLEAYKRCKADLGCMLDGTEYRRLVADERLKAICTAKGLGRGFDAD
jgi:hypothetical protein